MSQMSIINQDSGSDRFRSFDNGDKVSIDGSSVMLPADIQSRYAKTIQTHNAVNVAANAWAYGEWIDCNGFNDVALTLMNSASTASEITLQWSHDGVSIHGNEVDIALGTSNAKTDITPIKARFLKVAVNNTDGASSHVMSVWAYLKV